VTYPGIENDRQYLESNPDLLAVEDRRAARLQDYSKYVAAGPIPWGTVLAHVKGDPVPASNVERWKWDELGLVVKRSSKEGRAILEETGTATPEELEQWAGESKSASKSKDSDKTTSTAKADEKPKGGTN
jgi:hypothetical protein